MQADARQHKHRLTTIIGLFPLIIFLTLLLYEGLNAPNFMTIVNLKVVLTQSLTVVLSVIGLSAVVMAGGDDVVSGGIDLSVGIALDFGAAFAVVAMKSYGMGAVRRLRGADRRIPGRLAKRSTRGRPADQSVSGHAGHIFHRIIDAAHLYQRRGADFPSPDAGRISQHRSG